MVILWSEPARADLQIIHRYIARDSRHYATRVVSDIMEKVERLTQFPRIGRIVPEIGDDQVREISMYAYRIIYELKDDEVQIHMVIHGRRNFTPESLIR